MDNEDFKNIVLDILKNNNIDKNLFFIASICNGKNIIYDYSNNLVKPKEEYVIRYFSKYNAVVIWDITEHIPKTNKLSLSKKSLIKAIDLQNFIVKKGVEYKWWQLSNVYVSELSNLSEMMQYIIKKNYN